ncbi:MAG: hypothetical protein WBY53_16055 [Acidobacteriaceae bacterium]
MKLKLRLPLFITLIIASVGIGTMGVHASTDCQHLFKAYKQQIAKRMHHKVSPETLVRWAAWNKAHPHYRPTKKESLAKVDFVCDVPTDVDALSDSLPPIGLPPVLPSISDTFAAPSQPNIQVANLVPPDNPEQPPVGDPVYQPVYYPGPPTVFSSQPGPVSSISPTPEPDSLVLLSTALAMMAGLMFWKKRQIGAPDHQ